MEPFLGKKKKKKEKGKRRRMGRERKETLAGFAGWIWVPQSTWHRHQARRWTLKQFTCTSLSLLHTCTPKGVLALPMVGSFRMAPCASSLQGAAGTTV
jgi:hypothetical protein